MGAGIDASMVTATRLNINDLLLEIDGGLGGSITIQYHTYGVNNIIETMEFDDGSTLDLTTLDLTLHGTSAGETLYGVRFGGSGVDTIYGHDGNDVIYGYRGVADSIDNPLLSGGAGNDTFTFLAARSFDAVDVIKDFSSTYDAIDIADILSGYDPFADAITDFVQITDDGTDSTVFVDADGGDDNFVAIALIENRTGLTDEEALETSGNLIAA